MKNQIIFNFLTVIFIFIGMNISFASEEEVEDLNYDYYLQDFVISAYYSPLPNQTRYLRGSYENDIKLNGRGTNGADGTEVFMGMIAAPKSYSFGTLIDIPELGIGAVHDRGGAIIEKGDYHRIDIWMGSGDQGLSRALNWGMRRIIGKVYFEKDIIATNLDFTKIPATLPIVTNIKKDQAKVGLISKTLAFDIIDEQVVTLKEALKNLGYFSGETQNNYFGKDLESSIVRFQIDKKIISDTSSYGAGHVGLKTREALLDEIVNNNIVIKTPSEKVTSVQIKIQDGISKISSEDNAENLKVILSNLGYYEGIIDTKYSDDLFSAIFAFQKDNNILKNETDSGAGIFGPKTKEALEKTLTQRKEKISNFPKHRTIVFDGEKEENSFQASVVPKDVSFPAVRFNITKQQFAIGDKGENVEKLQAFLAQKGILKDEYITGYFGPITENAVSMLRTEVIK